MNIQDYIKRGYVVRLKSGGPEMTVEDTYLEYHGFKARCVWFEGTTCFREDFPALSLLFIRK